MSEPTLTVTADFTENFKKVIDQFRKDKVLVGIPEAETARQDDDPIGNAAILALNEFGSAKNNIPARHPMKTGIGLAQKEIAEQFKLAAQKALSQGSADVSRQYYVRAGIIASNSVKKVINDQTNFVPLSVNTIEARRRLGFMGTKALIVSGQLRNAITYVVKGGG